MPYSFSSIATVTEAIARTLESYQIDTQALFTSLDLGPEPFRDPDARVSKAKMEQIWTQAEARTGNPCIGFEIGQALTATNLHAVGYAWLASATLREGLQRIVRYQRLIATHADMGLSQQGDVVEMQIDREPGEDLGDDAAFAGLVRLCRDVSYPEFSPQSVHMMRIEPICAPKLAEYFACPIEYEASIDKICFTAESVDADLRRNNPSLAQASEAVARDYLANLDKKDVVARARSIIVARLPDGEPNRGAVASRLAMSERTLARRLSARNYTFTSLVDEVREKLGKEYLRQSRFSVTDIAFLLGFTDQSNFARAFKRWSGDSPSEFRSRLRRSS